MNPIPEHVWVDLKTGRVYPLADNEYAAKQGWVKYSLAPSVAEPPAKDVCWHCGVVLTPAPKPRCETCPDECDVELCTEPGCADALREKKETGNG